MVQILADIEFTEIELPGTVDAITEHGQASMLICEGETHLDKLHLIDVCLHGLVRVLLVRPGSGPKHDTGEFSVNGDVGMVVQDATDELKLCVEVEAPYLAYAKGGTFGDRHVEETGKQASAKGVGFPERREERGRACGSPRRPYEPEG